MNCPTLAANPSLYLSDYFERNRASYYDALMRVRVANDLIHRVRFFLGGMAETATKGRDVFRKIPSLRAEVEHAVLSPGTRAPNAKRMLNLRYRKPIASAMDVEMALAVGTPTANVLARDMEQLGVPVEITGQRRGRIYAFDRYLALFVS